MNIGILGAGNVGATLGTGWARKGHAVWFGSRDPQSAELAAVVAKAGANARAASLAEAAKAEVVVVTLPWPATREVLQGLDLRGRIVLDATNPLLPGLAGLELGHDTSGAEKVAEWAPGAKVVKIFNTTGYNNMADPVYHGQATFMPYCGDDAGAKQAAAQLAADLGFDAVDAGPLSHARLLEPWAMTWIWLAVKGGLGRDFAFQRVKR